MPEEYKAGPDNWATVQNKEGIIYFGNSTGVLEYDGVSWRLFELPNQNVVRSLAIDIKNKIYVGGNNDIGFLAPDGAGLMQFNSLKDQLDPSVRDFQDVWFTHVHNGEVYYESFKYLMRWNGKKFRVWETDFRFRFSKVINDTLYIMEEEVGLRKLVGDSLKTIIPITKLRDIQFYGLAPFDDGQIVALSYDKGLFLIKDNKLIPFSSPANAYLKKQLGYHLEKLPNGWYSVATLREGIVVIDNKGQIIRLLNKTHGLSDNSIYYQFTDREKWLWLATSQGISRVELLLPYTIFDDRLGVEGFVNNIYRHQGMLYVASNDGILQLEKEPRMNEYIFKHLENTFQGYDFLSIDHSLFAAANSGVYQIENGEIINTFNYAGATALHHSRAYADRLYIGYRGLASLKQVDGQWIDDGKINGITDDISEIAEDKEGNLWLESQVNGVWKVDFSVVEGNNNFHNPSVRHFIANKEIPKGLVSLKVIRGEPIFEISGEIYRYNKVMDSIIVDDTFGTPFGLNGKIMPLTEDQYGNVWMDAQLDSGSKQKNRLVAMRADGDSYTIKKISNERISHDVSEVLYPEDDGIVWYGGADGIVRHDTRVNVNADRDFKPMIRKIMANGDSLIFGGAGPTAQEVLLSHAFNNLRFEFAAPTFDDESANQFQFYLENFDNDWSAWTAETQKDYTNIPEGTYTFRLRTKNVYGTERSGASFAFEILPPMHRTWWAYSLYALFLAGFITGVVKWRSRKLQKEKEALENVVAERTAEVSTQARQLEKQAHELQELDRAKSQFFANISHEFRTPLTLILGQLRQLESGSFNKDPKPFYQMISRNGNRLLGLVNQLLDLSTLESGKMRLQSEKTDLISFMKPIVAAYDSLAESNGIEFSFKYTEDKIPIYLDRDKMEKVVQNVISNAFKFTGKGGKIVINADKAEIKGQQYAQIQVEDSGKGMAPDQLDKIFDRFYQADDINTKSSEGSGIGLALAKELMILQKGTISVKSEMGKGSCFTILLPLGKAHLSSGELIESPPFFDMDTATEPVIDQTPQQQQTITAVDDVATIQDAAESRDLPQILVVEDNADMHQYIHQVLHSHYQITEAGDGSAGYDKAVEMIPDLIISDVMMPKMDGLELCRRLKSDERTSHIPVILLTAKAGKTSRLEGLETRADDYLTKPFDADELLIVLRNRIEQRARLRAQFSREVTVQPKDVAITSADERFLQKAMDIVEKHMDDFDFNVEVFVEHLHLGHTQVNRKLKALTDFTSVQFIRFLRLKRAAQKIARQEDTISQIAYSVGFNNLSYFAKCFKEQFGTLPSDYLGD